MALHPDITRKSDVALALEAASGALLLASRQQTGNAGSVTIPNADGTKTVIGVDAGDATVAKWVGDTTAPGKPTGVTASSRNAALWVSWDGTLAGGVPADFDHVELFASTGGMTVDLGALREAGTVTAADLTVGSEYTVTAVAYDDAHDAQGNSTPNASEPSDAVSVTIASAVDPGAVEKAQTNAQSALDQIGGVKSDLTATQQTANDAKEQSASAAQQSQRAEDTAKSANAASASASSTAQTALSTAQAAQNDTVTQNVNQYAINTDPTTAPTTGWSPTSPAWTAGHYIWVRTIVGYGSGDYQTGDPVCVTGNTGAQGPQGAMGATGATGATGAQGVQGPKGDTGAQGPAGKDGADGTSVRIKGSVASAAALPSSANVGDGYITNDDGHLHVWGNTGFTDVGVIRGPNGVSAYLHTAWADSADGKTNFSTTTAGTRAYWGNYADNNSGADSQDPSKYVWQRTLGATGATGATGAKGDTGAQGPKGDTGANGSNGTNGVSVTSIVRYYALGTAAPAKPAVMAPPSPWQAAEPGYQRDVNLYTTERILYSDGQFAYTQVQLSSSYQYSAAAETAARDAVQTATNANTTANTAAAAAANAASQAQTATSTANSAQSTATQATATAASAAQSATSAQTTANLALANAQELLADPTFSTQSANWNLVPGDHVKVFFYSNNGDLRIDPDPGVSSFYVCAKAANLGGLTQVSYDRTYRISADALSPEGGNDTTFYISPKGNMNLMMPTSGMNKDSYTHFQQDVVLKAGSVLDSKTIIAVWTPGDAGISISNIHVRDITEAKAAQDAANAAQSTATSAATAAANADANAVKAQASANGAQTTADSKNTIRSSQSQPSAANTVPGDLWFQLDSSNHVTGIQVWNGSAYVDYVLVAQQVLVAGSVGTISLSDGAVTADKVTASTALLNKLLVRKIVADDIDVGSLTAAIVQSGLFRTGSSGARVEITSAGIKAYDANGNVTFQVDASTGKATMVGGMATALSGKRISISQSGDTGKVALLNDGSELSSLTFIDNTNSSGYVYTGLYTGQNAQFIQFATLVDNVNHQPDPKVYDASITARGKMLLDASNAINVNGTWFAHDQASLPTAPQVVGEQGTKAFAGGIEYTFDGSGAWVPQTQPAWVVCNTGNSYYKPQAYGSLQALSVRKRAGIVELMGSISVGGTVQQNSDMGAMIPVSYRPTTPTMIQCDQTQWATLPGPAWYVRPDGHIIWGPYKAGATDATFHGIWTA